MQASILLANDLAGKLKAGDAALFPTDTVPALGVKPEQASKLWKLKKRPLEKPLILLGANPNELLSFALPHVLDDVWPIAKKYWPGALTIIVPASGDVVDLLNPGAQTLGLRVPASSTTRKLLELTGPLATTSANLSGVAPSLIAEEVSNSFPGLPLLGPLPWPKASGLASTVISWQGEGCWDVLRRGTLLIKNFLN